ncbi:MAG: hypothetical protein DMG59_24565 [Acidobacteria bacterium]|nr:MAG: hypothetical protein DMG59_24565 [Acidobacteriota bacterium]
MSSKVYRADDQMLASPLAWRPAGGDSVQPARTQASGPGGQVARADQEREMETRVQAAYAQGHAAGEAAGTLRASERFAPVFAGLNGVVQELAGMRKRLRAEAEEDMVRLAIAIARRVLYRELGTDPEAILGLVKAGFPPDAAAAIEQNRARLELPPGLEIFPDASLDSGGAIFETSRGDLDASVNTQLAEIERGFADLMRRRAK